MLVYHHLKPPPPHIRNTSDNHQTAYTKTPPGPFPRFSQEIFQRQMLKNTPFPEKMGTHTCGPLCVGMWAGAELHPPPPPPFKSKDFCLFVCFLHLPFQKASMGMMGLLTGWRLHAKFGCSSHNVNIWHFHAQPWKVSNLLWPDFANQSRTKV